MICPYCSYEENKVLETRETTEAETRRRRECLRCTKRFTTYERIELKPLLVIKKDAKRERFDRKKIIDGLLKSCEKRPVSIHEIDEIVDNVEYKIRAMGLEEVKSTKIGTLVMNRLKKLDKIAYIRFASVYRDFTDIKSFQEELGKIIEKTVHSKLEEQNQEGNEK